jgi:hypothetical protein
MHGRSVLGTKPVRVMTLPEIPVTPQSRDDCIELYSERLSADRVCWPHASVLLTAYLAWPSDEERRNSFVATYVARLSRPSDEVVANAAGDSTKGLSLETFGGLAAVAKPAFEQLAAEISQFQRKWLLVADIFQTTVDMAFDERIVLRRGASVSKAIDLCEIECGLPGHSQLRAAWSEFRDVAHLLAASAYLAHEGLAHPGTSDESSILNAVWIAPDVVLALAYGLQEFGLQPKPIRKESPILGPNALWRVADCHKLEKPFVVFRRLSDTQLEFLNSRRVGKKVA